MVSPLAPALANISWVFANLSGLINIILTNLTFI